MTPRSTSEMLRDLARILGPSKVEIRCDTESLETVYLTLRDDILWAHDRGQTFRYLNRDRRATYKPWSFLDAQQACSEHAVALTDVSDGEWIGFRIEQAVGADTEVPDAIEAVSSAIEAVFRRHVR